MRVASSAYRTCSGTCRGRVPDTPPHPASAPRAPPSKLGQSRPSSANLGTPRLISANLGLEPRHSAARGHQLPFQQVDHPPPLAIGADELIAQPRRLCGPIDAAAAALACGPSSHPARRSRRWSWRGGAHGWRGDAQGALGRLPARGGGLRVPLGASERGDGGAVDAAVNVGSERGAQRRRVGGRPLGRWRLRHGGVGGGRSVCGELRRGCRHLGWRRRRRPRRLAECAAPGASTIRGLPRRSTPQLLF